MPLIRYYHSDRVCVGAPDACAITLPALDAVLGKEPVYFVFPGGITIRPVMPPTLIARDLGAQMYQVVQVAEDRCEFRIVPGRMAPADMRFEEITEYMRSRWWEPLQVDYRIMDELPRKPGARKLTLFQRDMR